jgi:ribulose-phosphate 3-epimerase
MIKIAPSILSADFTKLTEQIKIVEQAGADLLHLDIMDGHFVPNITFGPLLVEAVNRITELPLDIHLMIENPDNYIAEFKKAGADFITVHYEAVKHLHRTITRIKELGAKAGVSINPATPVSNLQDIVYEADMVLIMSVNPGFGGQKFIPQAIRKVEELVHILHQKKLDVLIEIDGGIDVETAPLVAKAGARILVAGSSIFKANNIGEAVSILRRSAQNSLSV